MALVDEITDSTSELDAQGMPVARRRLRLANAMDLPGGPTPETEASQPARPLAHRIMDDQQTGNRSGGPAGAYQDPGADARITELKGKLSQTEAPPEKVPLWQRIVQSGLQLLPVLGAGLSRQPGAMEGAEQGVEEGIQRRQRVQDIQGQQQFEAARTLSQQIEEEEKGQEQNRFNWQKELEQERMQQAGLTERTNLAEMAETGRANRLADTISDKDRLQREAEGARQDLAQVTGEQARQTERTKQAGRMQVEAAKVSGSEAVARIRAAAVSGKIPPLVGKAADDFFSSQERYDVMSQNLDKGLGGDQQAMLSLLANHIGMTMGLAKGARINQTIITEAMKSAPWLGRIEARFDDRGYLSGVTLTPDQMRSMVDLAQARLIEDSHKVSQMETYFGVRGGGNATPQAPPTGGGADGGGGAGATSIPKPPRPPDPGHKWQYNTKTGQFREIPIVAK